ncbi:MAG: class I SAM-dependent methyltransferase [Nitrospirota bacterium]|nr:class I SAM-dependent methyltransferase [Nitrospirota bacterium]
MRVAEVVEVSIGRGTDQKPASFRYVSSELAAMAEAENYRRWILRRFAPYLSQRIVEVGAGMGAFSDLLLREARPAALTLVEPADNLVSLLRQRFAGERRVTVVHGYLDLLVGSSPVDSVVLVNVLEHIEDDAAVLRIIWDLLVPGGALLLFVPALPWLYGSMDRAFGHVRRYRKPALAQMLDRIGYETVDLRYFNLLGVGPWLVAGRILQRQTLHPKAVRLYDRWVLPWLLKLESCWPPPIGQSLLAVARKPDRTGRENRDASRGER